MVRSKQHSSMFHKTTPTLQFQHLGRGGGELSVCGKTFLEWGCNLFQYTTITRYLSILATQHCATWWHSPYNSILLPTCHTNTQYVSLFYFYSPLSPQPIWQLKGVATLQFPPYHFLYNHSTGGIGVQWPLFDPWSHFIPPLSAKYTEKVGKLTILDSSWPLLGNWRAPCRPYTAGSRAAGTEDFSA